MSRKLRLLLALYLSLIAWLPMLGVLSGSHYYVNNIEVPPPLAVVMGLTILATTVTVLVWVWFVRSLTEVKQKRKRGQIEQPKLLNDGELADAWQRLAGDDTAATADYSPDMQTQSQYQHH